jgi:hypothetical protein
VLGEFADDHLSKHARSSNTTAHGTLGNIRSYHSVTTVRADILGQDVDLELKAGRDELQHARLIVADACLGLSTLGAKLISLGHVVLDANLRQSVVIGLA